MKTTRTIRNTLRLRLVKPTTIPWNEFGALLRHIQRTIVPLYNQASVNLYLHLMNPATKLRRGNESAIVRQWSNEQVYAPAYETLCSSHIALGLKLKLESSFSGSKVWDIKYGKAASPFLTRATLPIPFNYSTPFKLYTREGEFYIDIPFPWYETQAADVNETRVKSSSYPTFTFVRGNKKKHVEVLLSTKNRKSNAGWLGDNGTEAEVKRVMDGTYPVTTFELLERNNRWYIHLSIRYTKELKPLNEDKYGGIDLGYSNPIVCAINGDYNRLTIRGNDISAITGKQPARLRDLGRNDRLAQGGHGRERRFRLSESVSERYRRRRRKKMEDWASQIGKFFVRNNVGMVFMEELGSGIKDAREQDTGEKKEFKQILRLRWPVAELQALLERKLSELGVKVKYKSPSYTSQYCAQCGRRNIHFTFQYRQDHGFPKFTCACGFIAYADYNAALNIANPSFEKLTPTLRTKAVESQREAVKVEL